MKQLIAVVVSKALWELDCIYGYLRFPFYRRVLPEMLAASLSALQVETTNRCNARCVFCGYQHQTRPTGVMSRELFEKVVSEFAECGGGALGLTPTVGDPLLDPLILDRIRFARSFPSIGDISMFTNLIALPHIGADALLRSGITSVLVSCSGFNAEMFARVYRSPMYAQMLSSLLNLASTNNALGRPVSLFVDMRVDRPLREVLAYPDHQKVAGLVGQANIGVKLRYDSWGGLITQEQLPGNMKIRRWVQPRISPCTSLFAGLTVYWDGKVGACGCRDLNASELIVGNAGREHVQAIWEGDTLKKLRAEFLSPACKRLCLSCEHYNNLSLYLRRDNRRLLDRLRRRYLDSD